MLDGRLLWKMRLLYAHVLQAYSDGLVSPAALC